MVRITEDMANRLIRITRKYGLNYGESYDELYGFFLTLSAKQQQEMSTALLKR
jgi:hypothetical protein